MQNPEEEYAYVEKLDRFVIEAIREKPLGREAEKKIRDSIIRAKQGEEGKFTRDEKRLAQLRSKTERGTENLALADRANFMAISKLLDQWREEELVLADSLEKNGAQWCVSCFFVPYYLFLVSS